MRKLVYICNMIRKKYNIQTMSSMKRYLPLILMALLPKYASAYDAEIDGIFYNFTGNKATVTYKDGAWLNSYKGDLVIPTSVTYEGKTYDVTAIGDKAISNCSDLNSITIPESVTIIGYNAFYWSTGLTSINIPGSVKSIGNYAFYHCTSLKSVTISEGLTTIGVAAFWECSALTSISIPNSVTSIGDGAFKGCSSLTSIVIPEGMERIRDDTFSGCYRLSSVTIPNGLRRIGIGAFQGCIALTSITIPESVTTINESAFGGCRSLSAITLNCPNVGSWFANLKSLKEVTFAETVTNIADNAFSGCAGLTTITIPNSTTAIGENAFRDCSNFNTVSIGNSVTSIGKNAFTGCSNVKFYVERGTDGLLSVWNYGKDPYEAGTSQILLRPSISEISKTQTTVSFGIDNVYPELEYECDNYTDILGENEYIIKGLRPDCAQPINLSVKSANNTYNSTFKVTTALISPTLTCEVLTASSMTVKVGYAEGDAKVVDYKLVLNGNEIPSDVGKFCGLDPDSYYNFVFSVIVEYGEGEQYRYYATQHLRTDKLRFATLQPKVIADGDVVIAAESNLDDEETNVGFEWRRIDWTDDFASNTGGAYLFGGRMEGNIRNLNPDKLWKYRPYYESNAGNRHYGEWVGIDPTNTSYFEPTIYTYPTNSISENTAEVKGYVMRGSENVVSQGFVYWKASPQSSTKAIEKRTPAIPANAMIVEAKGNMMVVSLEDLDYDTEYFYVAFVKTSSNEIYYGEEQTFKTGMNQSMVDNIGSPSTSLSKGEGEVYDLSGRKVSKSQPRKGINIIRYSDGTTRKVLIK